MEDFEKKDFSKILKHNALEGRRWMNSTASDAVRVYDRNLPAFPITIELYGSYARAVDYSDGGMSDPVSFICLCCILCSDDPASSNSIFPPRYSL